VRFALGLDCVFTVRNRLAGLKTRTTLLFLQLLQVMNEDVSLIAVFPVSSSFRLLHEPGPNAAMTDGYHQE